jgi:hypothetical protein
VDDKEWRAYFIDEVRSARLEMISELKEVRRENKEILQTVTTLKVKVGLVVAAVSAIISLVVTTTKSKLGL